MNVSKYIRGSFRLFDTAVFVKRFDVLDSPTGIFTDLTWELSDRYVLPRISDLSELEQSIDLKVAWHEKGLFFQSEFPVDANKSPIFGGPPKLTLTLLINCRHAPGIQRANANCTKLCCNLERTTQAIPQSNGYLRWVKVNRAKEVSHDNIDSTFAPVQLQWIQGEMCKLKCFVGTQCLPSYNPVEFSELSFEVIFDHHYHNPYRFGNTYYSAGSVDNPSCWCVAKLVDK